MADVPLEVDRGTRYAFRVRVIGADASWTALFTVKRRPDLDPLDTAAVITKTAAFDTEGWATIALSETDTLLEPDLYRYDVRTLPNIANPVRGSFNLRDVITNRTAP